MAKEVQQGSNQQSSADVTIYITDDNDHPPVFEQSNYTAEIPEHSPAGTVVIQVRISFQQFFYKKFRAQFVSIYC